MEGGGPEAGFLPQWIKRICGGSLAVEAESSTDQTVVAAPVVAAVAVKAGAVAGRRAQLAGRTAGDPGRAGFASGHPGQDHVNQGAQNQAHRDGHTESYDQRDSIKRLKYFQKEICVVLGHDFKEKKRDCYFSLSLTLFFSLLFFLCQFSPVSLYF